MACAVEPHPPSPHHWVSALGVGPECGALKVHRQCFKQRLPVASGVIADPSASTLALNIFHRLGLLLTSPMPRDPSGADLE
ncbi:hypothetical protein MHYP_G00225280 [Metynnis hypsauchen]